MVPRKVGTSSFHGDGTTWEVAAPAKLNLYLEVLGKRSDGFHELETLMVPVCLFDTLRWSPQSDSGGPDSVGVSLSIDQYVRSTPLGTDGNLVIRAAELIATHAGIEPHGHFHVTKRIPMQAGMGGGSSNAAATLLLANAAWELGLKHSELSELAAKLGSDVPYFLQSSSAICRGRGERIEPIAGLPRISFVLVKPDFGLSTPEIFGKLQDSEKQASAAESASRLGSLIAELRAGAIGKACRLMTNRLEGAAARIAPEIERIKSALARVGCQGQLMTGSGSTVVGIARSAGHARRLAHWLSAQNVGTVLATASCG
jgi:4-diphosphocytidyl-2-C-methyl-D-erythritol kinase